MLMVQFKSELVLKIESKFVYSIGTERTIEVELWFDDRTDSNVSSEIGIEI